jgi:hypothetical protein
MPIFSKSAEEHERHLRQVCQRLEENGLTINFDKSKLHKEEIEFLGNVISGTTIKPKESKVEAIQEFSPPTNKKDLQSFLGLTSYVSKFIPEKTAPLQELLIKNRDFVWSLSCQNAFEEIEASMKKSLAVFDRSAFLSVLTDASPYALGAVLIQNRQSMNPGIIAYVSRSLTPVEKKYSQVEKEALALVWACERFCMYVIGKKFELLTDHKPLETLFSKKISLVNARIERWQLQLQNFDYVVKYIKGEHNLADPLSRLCHCPSDTSSEKEAKKTEAHIYAVFVAATLLAISLNEIRQETAADDELQAVCRALRNEDTWPKTVTSFKIF